MAEIKAIIKGQAAVVATIKQDPTLKAEVKDIGPQGIQGPQGDQGDQGDPGIDGDDVYVYIAYASDSSGTGFTTTFNASLDYIAVKKTTSPIASPAVGDFTGLWKKYKGEVGATGATGPQGNPGTGDVNGPATNTDGNIPQWDGANSKLLKNGIPTSTFEPAKGTDDNYATDAEKVKLANLSGTNTGDASTPAETTTTIGSLINGATGKTTPVDADTMPIIDTEASNVLKKLTFTNLKAFLKTYFDTLYQAVGSYVTAAGFTLTGEIDLGENAGLVLDAALSADGKYSGIVEAGTAGATLVFGDLCYLNNDDSRWELVDANLSDGYDKKLGMCVLAAGADGNATKMLLFGKINAASNFPALTVGAPVYMAETAGDIVVAQPTTADVAIRIMGFGNTADELFFNPSPDYIVHT